MERTQWQAWMKLFFLVMNKQSFNQIFSCPCLYDHCLVSSYLKENLEEITSRISEVVNKYWLVDIDVTPTLLININKKVFVTCITHAKRMLDNLVLTSVDNELLV